MQRREFITLIGAAAAWPFSAGAQQASRRMPRVGALIGFAEKNRALAKELVSLEPDVIFVNSTSATAAVLGETRTIPVVFATVSDPVGSGFVASLARPGGNVTGFVNVEGSIAGKWLGFLKEVMPGLRAAGLMYNP